MLPFPAASGDGGKLTVLIMVSLLFCVSRVLYNFIVLLKKKFKDFSTLPCKFLSPECCSRVALIFFSELLFFSSEFYQQFLC